jgi:hypothetical protein
MAPCAYIRLALGVAPGGRIHFGSLEFTDTDRLAPKNSLLPSQALFFRDLDFVADHLGQPQLSEENVAPPHISTLDHVPAHAGPVVIDSDALACRIDAYLGANLERELGRCVFYVLANAFVQLSESRSLPPEAKF